MIKVDKVTSLETLIEVIIQTDGLDKAIALGLVCYIAGIMTCWTVVRMVIELLKAIKS